MKQSEILAAQTNSTDTTPQNTVMVNRIPWENSPITICSIEEGNKWFLALGTRRLTEYYEYQHQVEELLELKSWELITQIAIAIAEDHWNYRQAEHAQKVKEIYQKDVADKFENAIKKSAENLANFNEHQAAKHGINLKNGL